MTSNYYILNCRKMYLNNITEKFKADPSLQTMNNMKGKYKILGKIFFHVVNSFKIYRQDSSPMGYISIYV